MSVFKYHAFIYFLRPPPWRTEQLAVRQFPLSVNSGMPIATINHRIGFQQEMRENYQLRIWMGFPLSVICSGRPIELDKPLILALAAETGFLLFKEQVPLKFKKEISAAQCERKTFRLISLSTPVSVRFHCGGWSEEVNSCILILSYMVYL